MSDMKSPAFMDKIKAGPVGFMTITSGWNFNMGGTLFQWFLYSLVVSLFAGYIAGVAFGPGTEYLRILQVAGASRSSATRWRRCTSRFGGAGAGAGPSGNARRSSSTAY